jgi:hypothetical protein
MKIINSYKIRFAHEKGEAKDGKGNKFGDANFKSSISKLKKNFP